MEKKHIETPRIIPMCSREWESKTLASLYFFFFFSYCGLLGPTVWNLFIHLPMNNCAKWWDLAMLRLRYVLKHHSSLDHPHFYTLIDHYNYNFSLIGKDCGKQPVNENGTMKLMMTGHKQFLFWSLITICPLNLLLWLRACRSYEDIRTGVDHMSI